MEVDGSHHVHLNQPDKVSWGGYFFGGGFSLFYIEFSQSDETRTSKDVGCVHGGLRVVCIALWRSLCSFTFVSCSDIVELILTRDS